MPIKKKGCSKSSGCVRDQPVAVVRGRAQEQCRMPGGPTSLVTEDLVFYDLVQNSA